MNEQGRETTKLIVTDELSGKTVLALLRTLRPGESWSQLRTQLRKACVSLNDIVCIDEARRVAVGDVVAVGEHPLAPPPTSEAVRIHFVDAHVVVVEKPSGMMTHRRPEERNWSAERKGRLPSLEEAVIELLVRRAEKHGHARPRGNIVRCVHRLDRDTSGLIVFARNDEAEQSLVDQFRRHEVIASTGPSFTVRLAMAPSSRTSPATVAMADAAVRATRKSASAPSRTFAGWSNSEITASSNAGSKRGGRIKFAFISPKRAIWSAVT